jgi:hypothetical protein
MTADVGSIISGLPLQIPEGAFVATVKHRLPPATSRLKPGHNGTALPVTIEFNEVI